MEGIHVHDSVTLVAAVCPELFTTEEMAGDVETMGELTVGATLFDRLLADNAVCADASAHFFLNDVSHTLKVRVVADDADRRAIATEREGLSESEASELLARLDEASQRWGVRVLRVDPRDPLHYDALVHVGKMGVDGAVDIVCRLAGHPQFQQTPESQQRLVDLALAARVEVVTLEMQLDADVTANQRKVTVKLLRTPRFRAGTFSQFDKQYAHDIERRLREACTPIADLAGVTVAPPDV